MTPRAWACFADTGNCIIWSTDEASVRSIADKHGRAVTPLCDLAEVTRATDLVADLVRELVRELRHIEGISTGQVNRVAKQALAQLRAIREQGEHSFLFSDVASLVLKEPEFVEMVIKNRVAEHQAIEAARIETERQRIANEERAKAEASERARADAEIAEAKRASEEAIAKAQQATLVANVAAMAKNETQHFTYPAETVEPVKDDADNNMRLGQICEKLGFTITAEFLSGLGFEPSATEKNAKLYKTRLFPLICRALVNHINSVYAVQEA
jgi:hypothetical protein